MCVAPAVIQPCGLYIYLLEQYNLYWMSVLMSERTFERRGRHDIIMQILKTATKGAKKTHIMNKANLSFYQVKRYLSHLKKAGFVTEESGIWKTTRKGFHVIDACKICHGLMEEVI